MKGKIFASLFALPFLGVGVWMLWEIGTAVYDTARMSDWVQVEATLTAAGYETHSGDDSDTYEAYAQYTYTFQGQRYYGDRVSLAGGADNIGDYQRDKGRELQYAFETRGPGGKVTLTISSTKALTISTRYSIPQSADQPPSS